MRRAAIGGVLMLLVLAAWWRWPSDARRVQARLEAAAAALSAPAGEGDLQRVARVAALARCLAPDVVVEAEPGGAGIRGREAVTGLATRVAGSGGPLAIDVRDVDVELAASGEQAVATAFVTVSGRAAGQAAGYDGNVVRFELTKQNGEWLIARAVPEPNLQRWTPSFAGRRGAVGWPCGVDPRR